MSETIAVLTMDLSTLSRVRRHLSLGVLLSKGMTNAPEECQEGGCFVRGAGTGGGVGRGATDGGGSGQVASKTVGEKIMLVRRLSKGKLMVIQELLSKRFPLIWQTTRKESTSSKPPPVLTLYTKYPCPLCDEALEALGSLLHQVKLEKIDIEAPGNEKLWKSYRYDIPVFHFNGQYLMKHRADIGVFNKALKDYFKVPT